MQSKFIIVPVLSVRSHLTTKWFGICDEHPGFVDFDKFIQT